MTAQNKVTKPHTPCGGGHKETHMASQQYMRPGSILEVGGVICATPNHTGYLKVDNDTEVR